MDLERAQNIVAANEEVQRLVTEDGKSSINVERNLGPLDQFDRLWHKVYELDGLQFTHNTYGPAAVTHGTSRYVNNEDGSRFNVRISAGIYYTCTGDMEIYEESSVKLLSASWFHNDKQLAPTLILTNKQHSQHELPQGYLYLTENESSDESLQALGSIEESIEFAATIPN